MPTIFASSLLALLLLFIILLAALAMEFEVRVLHGIVEAFWDEPHHISSIAPFVQREVPRFFTTSGARLRIALYANLLSIIPLCTKIALISHVRL